MPGLSIHVVDVSRGVPATGMQARVYAVGGAARAPIAESFVTADGLVHHPINDGEGLVAGVYEIELDVGAYYRTSLPDKDAPLFLEVAVFRFTVTDPADHIHLPFKLSPWGLSVWRGR